MFHWLRSSGVVTSCIALLLLDLCIHVWQDWYTSRYSLNWGRNSNWNVPQIVFKVMSSDHACDHSIVALFDFIQNWFYKTYLHETLVKYGNNKFNEYVQSCLVSLQTPDFTLGQCYSHLLHTNSDATTCHKCVALSRVLALWRCECGVINPQWRELISQRLSLHGIWWMHQRGTSPCTFMTLLDGRGTLLCPLALLWEQMGLHSVMSCIDWDNVALSIDHPLHCLG